MIFKTETRGIFKLPLKKYGTSFLGSPLWYVPCKNKCEILFIAGIHGEEPETTFLLSRALRAFDDILKNVAFVLCANPDGMTLGTRGNFNGVDLNRNFSTSNWSSQATFSRSILEANRDTKLSSGKCCGSEAETIALQNLIAKLKPQKIISMHAPIGCVESIENSLLTKNLCKVFSLKYVADIGYKTPGSLGTWCTENKIECITLELPRMSLEALFERFGNSFAEFLKEL